MPTNITTKNFLNTEENHIAYDNKRCIHLNQILNNKTCANTFFTERSVLDIGVLEYTTLPRPRYGHSSVYYRDSVFIFGGREGSQGSKAPSSRSLQYNTTSKKWTVLRKESQYYTPRVYGRAELKRKVDSTNSSRNNVVRSLGKKYEDDIIIIIGGHSYDPRDGSEPAVHVVDVFHIPSLRWLAAVSWKMRSLGGSTFKAPSFPGTVILPPECSEKGNSSVLYIIGGDHNRNIVDEKYLFV